MLQAIGRTKDDIIRSEELLNFPCTDLRTIDHLWVKYSNGRFGFSIQKQIYLEVGGLPDGKYYEEAWKKFADRVGWKNLGGYEINLLIGIWIERWISAVGGRHLPRGHLPIHHLCMHLSASLLSHQDL